MEDEKREVSAEAASADTRRNFWRDESGVGVIEIVLITVVLIGLVLIFKDQITAIVNNAFTAVAADAGKIIE